MQHSRLGAGPALLLVILFIPCSLNGERERERRGGFVLYLGEGHSPHNKTRERGDVSSVVDGNALIKIACLMGEKFFSA